MPDSWWLETLIFLVLLAASAYGFWRRFGAVLRRIRAAKRDADFSLHPVARRARDFFWEVMLQAKVIRERPLPGLAHAFVFWGFCAFALVTLNHLAAGVGLSFISREHWFGAIYFYLAAAFAIAVAVSIVGLAIRRFVVRPRWLGGKVSSESGIIAILVSACTV